MGSGKAIVENARINSGRNPDNTLGGAGIFCLGGETFVQGGRIDTATAFYREPGAVLILDENVQFGEAVATPFANPYLYSFDAVDGATIPRNRGRVMQIVNQSGATVAVSTLNGGNYWNGKILTLTVDGNAAVQSNDGLSLNLPSNLVINPGGTLSLMGYAGQWRYVAHGVN